MGVAHMDDGGRRCALPGCDRTITTTAGRPERRYCTAAHRAAARRARRAAVPAEQPDGPDALADALPWLRDAIGTGAARAGDSDDPGAEPVRPGLPAEVTPALEVSSGSRDRRPMPRRRHALALLGVAGILAGGYAVTDAAPEPQPVQTAPEGAAAPDGAAADTWAQRATVALASVNRQLDTLAQTEDEWRRLPESGRAVVPAPVAALEERRSVLQRRRATLQAQLDDYRSLRRTQQELANSEQHLRAVETALADAPPRRRRSAEQEAAIAALEEQRDLRIRRRDVQRTELASLQDGVSTATRTPLPDDGAATATITDDVMEMVHNGGTEPARPDPKPPRPEVVAGRESEDGKPRQEVGTSGPPDPRGPRDESDERRAAKEKRAAKDTDGEARKTEEPTSPARGKQDDAAQRRDVGGTGAVPTAGRRRRKGRARRGEHAPVDRSSEKPRDDRKPAEKHPAAGTDSGGEKSAEKPVETSVVEDAAKSHDRQKDRESPDKDATESRAHYRQTEMREPTERKSASTDMAERGSQYRHTDRSGSTNRESANKDTTARASTYRGSKDRDAKERDCASDATQEVTHSGTASVIPKHASRRTANPRTRSSPQGPRFQGPRLQGAAAPRNATPRSASPRTATPRGAARRNTGPRSGRQTTTARLPPPTGRRSGCGTGAPGTVQRTGDPDRAGPPRAGAGGRRDGSGAVVAAWRRRSVPRHRYRHPL